MSSYIISKLRAVSSEPKEIIKHLPARLSASALVQVLGKLGFVPTQVAASATSLDELRASGFQISTKSLDEAIAKYSDLSISDRLRLKYALNSANILR